MQNLGYDVHLLVDGDLTNYCYTIEKVIENPENALEQSPVFIEFSWHLLCFLFFITFLVLMCE